MHKSLAMIMSSNLGQIRTLTMVLADLDCPELMYPFFSVAIDPILSNLKVTMTCIISWMTLNFGQIGPSNTGLHVAALEHLKIDVSTFSVAF